LHNQRANKMTNCSIAFFKDDFYWAVSIMEQNLTCDPRRAICNNSNFEFCILQLFAGLSACQLARCKENILHFLFCIFLQTRNFAKIERKHRNFAVCKGVLHLS
jgi:hypothetical protein